MRHRILFIGSIIFASNVAFGQTLVTLPQPAETVAQVPVPFEQEIAAELISRGLEEQAAKALSKNSVKEMYDATLLTHMLSTKLGIERAEVHAYIASQALFQKRVDLRKYDDIVAMVQQIKGVSMHQDDLKAVAEYVAIV